MKESQGKRVAALDRAMVQLLSIDPSDPVYRYSRLGPSLGITFASVPGLIKSLPEWGRKSVALGRAFRTIEQTSKISELGRRGCLYNRARFEEYKILLRAEMEKPYVSDSRLKDYVDLIYKPGAVIGSGSTAAAIRQEITTGERVFARFHSQKGREMIASLEKWLRNNPSANLGDRGAVENIIKDLRNSLGE